MSTKFGADSSSRFLLECGRTQKHTHTHTQTHKVTDATDHPAHASATAGVSNYPVKIKTVRQM